MTSNGGTLVKGLVAGGAYSRAREDLPRKSRSYVLEGLRGGATGFFGGVGYIAVNRPRSSNVTRKCASPCFCCFSIYFTDSSFSFWIAYSCPLCTSSNPNTRANPLSSDLSNAHLVVLCVDLLLSITYL